MADPEARPAATVCGPGYEGRTARGKLVELNGATDKYRRHRALTKYDMKIIPEI
jgi:hypothetical protein